MTRSRHVGDSTDSDAQAVRRASRIVGVQIAVACAVVVLGIVVAVFLFVISQVKPSELFEPIPDTNNLDVSAEDVLRAAVILGIVLIILAGALSWFVTRRAVRPLGEALRIQRSFVADASHELRTPLTVLDARLQVLQRGLSPDDPSGATVVELRRDTKSLIDIVNDLLEAAEVEAANTNRVVATQLNPVLELAVDSMRLIGEEKAVRITIEDSEPVWTYLAPTSAHRCVVALLDNALRFSPDRSTVVVTVAATKSTVSVTVRDSGPGIQGIDPARVFDRFAHSGAAIDGGGSTRSGFGIGLALVRDIAVRQGGSVRVLESSASGTAIVFSVPRAR
jgi:two-component system OmpR family sensor kinase